VAFFAALAFVTGIAVMVLLAKPPGLVVAIITVVGVGVLLRTFVPSSVWARASGRRAKARAAADQPQRATTDPIADPQS